MDAGRLAATALIGVDWGTSQLRAFRISSAGRALERRENAQGIAAVRDGEFDQVLRSLIADWRPEAGSAPILMCGMIGSRQGWREAPYRSCPARPPDLIDTLQRVDTSCGPALIVGGVSTTDGRGRPDIMRGEETQIFGAVASTARQLAVAPGTHSKWAVVDGGCIQSFRTYMTGELYSLLCKHSSLSWLMGNVDHEFDDQAFLSGVHQAFEDAELLHALFSVRTSALFERQPPGALAAYLSGLLIGSEVAGATRHHATSPILVIASAALARLYRNALAATGFADVTHVDASEAVVRGLWQLWRLHAQEA
jgi:2-dehydro-3-deoxygalactonokinase